MTDDVGTISGWLLIRSNAGEKTEGDMFIRKMSIKTTRHQDGYSQEDSADRGVETLKTSLLFPGIINDKDTLENSSATSSSAKHNLPYNPARDSKEK